MFIKVAPKESINYSFNKTKKILTSLIGQNEVNKAFDIKIKYPSPVSENKDSKWLKKSKIISINPRIVGSYFNIIKYAMTFPEDTIHILPIWEVGCEGSLYARVNWQLDDQWLDKDLVRYGYKTSEQQLKLVINLLHALGKKVGFDCVPHTDKFSEEVFIIPECFEWIRLNQNKTKELIYNENTDVYAELKQCVIDYLTSYGSANGLDTNTNENIYSLNFDEIKAILFGNNKEKRISRRIELINYVREQGFETRPVTEHAPCRPIVYDCIKENEFGTYAEFKIENKKSNAKIFNSITPYKWYEIDKNGYPLINKPIETTFNYFFEQVEKFQDEYNFDFLRADMAHNQISHSHINEKKDNNFEFEMWKLLKQRLQLRTPYFGTFAEAFLGDYYIDGKTDMINKNFDIVLGNSNFYFLDSNFIKLIKDYVEDNNNFNFSPCIVSITNDSDQKHNNKFYQSEFANEIRYFIQCFLSLPGYAGMGFECRNLLPKNDTEYSALYANYQNEKYEWGANKSLFKEISKIRKLYSKMNFSNLKTNILETTSESILTWFLSDEKSNEPLYICIVNLDPTFQKMDISYSFNLNSSFENKIIQPLYSLQKSKFFIKQEKLSDKCIKNFDFCDARIYKIK